MDAIRLLYMKTLLNQHIKRDFIVCLCIWFGLEVIGFVILPLAGATDIGKDWFIPSVLLGILGAFLFALSSQVILTVPYQQQRVFKVLQWLVGIIFAWLGLAGVAFPLLVMGVQIFQRILENLMK
ncbi:MAG TPA: hypothetical protein V6C88_09920 [Chroococcidiopsis sp.]